MRELIEVLLGWLSVFQGEYEELQRLQYSPQDLLGVSVGSVWRLLQGLKYVLIKGHSACEILLLYMLLLHSKLVAIAVAFI